ncbi:hypothetical protein BDA99DRAFT_447825 [Phascolomyces articulosus]|uniref:Uncharacterized protein n=1 Tax=Phascolomyces articulosus TaxID=60185 RepID=A0AAD5P7J3_9FUNG|nr:hypothetical protein BDA99DRAFT_447825 [Phascolomyces articulosus]
MILLILYYVYKWMTVPWSYYESARSRRMIHQKSSIPLDERKQLSEMQRRAMIADELRRHELVGLFWVIISPLLAGYTLQYSRYFLSNYERYMSSFNVVVFVLAASLKPLAHVMTLLRERTLYLQSEIQASESQVQLLQRKLDLMEDELDTLRKAFATKKDLGQVTDGLNPTIQQLAKTLRRFEKKETVLRSWSEERFSSIEQKVQEFDQFICYRIEQDQRQSAHGMVVTLVLLPLNITLWVVKRMTGLLPVPRALLGHASTTATKSNVSFHPHHHHHHHNNSKRSTTGNPAKHLTHPDSESGSIIASSTEPIPVSVSDTGKTGGEQLMMAMNQHRSVQR